jgi:hypothetical protein
MNSLGLAAIYTFDRKMDRYPGVARLEPYAARHINPLDS